MEFLRNKISENKKTLESKKQETIAKDDKARELKSSILKTQSKSIENAGKGICSDESSASSSDSEENQIDRKCKISGNEHEASMLAIFI